MSLSEQLITPHTTSFVPLPATVFDLYTGLGFKACCICRSCWTGPYTVLAARECFGSGLVYYPLLSGC